MTTPGTVICWRVGALVSKAAPPRCSTSFASPKSSTFTRQSRRSMTFSGLRSRWTMPASCAASTAAATCTATSSASSIVSGARRMRRAPLTIEEALDVAVQVAAAVEAAHEAGIVHRDLKPENVMLRRDCLVKVLDFGLAKLVEQRGGAAFDTKAPTRQQMTVPGVVMGTVAYMSPEQARGLAVDERTDIWSLGVLLYEMLAGRRPFAGETKADVIAAILTTEPPPPARESEPVPDELCRIVLKALRARREERYQTVKDFLVDLKSLRRELEFSARSHPAPSQTSVPHNGDAAPARPGASAAARFSPRRLFYVLPVAVLLLGAAWWLSARRGAHEAAIDPSSLKTTEITSWRSAPGEGDSPCSFSPDGKKIAFSSTQGGTKNIWVRHVASGEAVQVTKD